MAVTNIFESDISGTRIERGEEVAFKANLTIDGTHYAVKGGHLTPDEANQFKEYFQNFVVVPAEKDPNAPKSRRGRKPKAEVEAEAANV